MILGIFLFVMLIITIVAIIVSIVIYFSFDHSNYPERKIDVNVTNKSNMDNNEALDYYIITYGTAVIDEHINNINKWKKEKIDKCKGNSKRIERLKNKWEKFDYKAFKFNFYRSKTRYRQQNYVKHSYKVDVSSNVFNVSDKAVTNRITFLKSHNYYVTFNQYNKEDQRKAMTPALKKMIKERDNYTCQICGKYMPDEVGLHIDHIIPIKMGGKSIPSNLRVLCDKCNCKKGAKVIKDTTCISQEKKVIYVICPICKTKLKINDDIINFECPSCHTKLIKK